jgi:hypothetical protein
MEEDRAAVAIVPYEQDKNNVRTSRGDGSKESKNGRRTRQRGKRLDKGEARKR